MKKTITLNEDQVLEVRTALRLTQQYIKDFCDITGAEETREAADCEKWLERVQIIEETLQVIREALWE